MADLSVTAANVLAGTNAKIRKGIAGATITAGQWVYEDTADGGKFKLADCDASATTAKAAGVALNGAAAGQPLLVCEEDDDFTPGGTLTVGAIYVLSGTAGAAAPTADLASGDWVTVLMVAKSATKAVLKRMVSGAQVPA